MSEAPPGVDAFGIEMLYPTAPDGLSWVAQWDQNPRTFGGQDPSDEWFDADHGDATYSVPGDGTLRISGDVPRMYIHDPELSRQWRNVEMTMYFRRVDDDGPDYAGLTGIARSNHGTIGRETENLCDTRGLGARMRYDGAFDFEKETSHPESTAVARVDYWDGGMPFDVWIGYRSSCTTWPTATFDKSFTSTKVTLRQAGTGNWSTNTSTQATTWVWVVNPVPAASIRHCGLRATPSVKARSRASRNLTCYFRSDNVGPEGLWYKKAVFARL